MLSKPKSTRCTYAVMSITTPVDFVVLNTSCVYTANGVSMSHIQRS